jgi:hypothetical protein
MQLIMATAPAEWIRQDWQQLAPDRDLVVLCEENTFPSLPPHAVAIVLDSVRYPPGFLRDLPNAVVTLDAPAEGCAFGWTPIRAELFHPKPWSERAGVICPVRLKNYPMRQKYVDKLVKIGVKIIERDDEKRSYQDYVDDLCSAKAVINFCQDRKTGKAQVKGRVFEALTAGAVLFEEANNLSKVYPVECLWSEPNGLKYLIQWVNDCPEAAKTVAEIGCAESARHFSAEAFWGLIERHVYKFNQ